MDYFLTADCGGTKSAFLLADVQGHRLAETVKDGSNYMVDGMDHMIRVLRSGMEECCELAGISNRDIRMFFIATAGYGDIPENNETDTRIVRESFPNVPLVLGSDTENAIAGSLLGAPGIHLIAGTGSIGIGMDLEGNQIRCGGWHHFFGGDEGSAYWIACHLLQEFTKQADGRAEKTTLYDYLMDKYHLQSAEEILDLTLNRWQCRREKIALMALDASQLASDGDPAAARIFDQAGEELAQIVSSVYSRGKFPKPVTISWSGGVFHSRQYFIDSLQYHLRRIPHILKEPALDPLPGGILCAMRESGVSWEPQIIQTLKESV